MSSINVLGICPGHNSSVTVVADGKVKLYLEEERLSRSKYDHGADLALDYVAKNFNIDYVAVVGTQTGRESNNIVERFLHRKRKYNPTRLTSFFEFGNDHHLTHAACAFYNSGFDTALCVVVDGAGSVRFVEGDTNNTSGFETESVFLAKKPFTIQPLYRKMGNNFLNNNKSSIKSFNEEYTENCNIVKSYEAVTDFLGFHYIEAGKTMGLASYGKPNNKFDNIFVNGTGSRDFFKPMYPAGGFVVDQETLEYKVDNQWHKEPFMVNDVMKDLAYAVQDKSQRLVLDLIREKIESTGIKNVVISGGYGLNCVANYFFKKNLPSDVNIYNEPISHDGGTSMGAAMLAWNIVNGDFVEEEQQESDFKLNTLYLGPEYDIKDIDSYVQSLDNFEIKEASYSDIVDLLIDEDIVCMYQGRSEAGPRSLGNRSILFDPRVKNGKDLVNQVKHREWFRPFAGSVLKENANDWFDMAGLEESPFMMYAVDVLPEKAELIPSITHVDNTCRIQTVTEEQNKHYYNLIKVFGEKTGVPILFNTSFNLAGDPLVEHITEAIATLEKSEMKYLYLPELGKLLIKKEETE